MHFATVAAMEHVVKNYTVPVEFALVPTSSHRIECEVDAVDTF